MRLFKEVVRQVWKQRQAASLAALRGITATLEALRERKNRVVDLFVDGRIDQDTYDQQVLRSTRRYKNQNTSCTIRTLNTWMSKLFSDLPKN